MLTVVVPTFNEGKNINNLVKQIDAALKNIDYEILFVDDSKDNTPDIIRKVAKEYPSVRMEHRENESGLATAVLKGFRLAKGEKPRIGEVIIQEGLHGNIDDSTGSSEGSNNDLCQC